MRALGILRADKPGQVEVIKVDVPDYADNEVLVRVHATAIGSQDRLWRPTGSTEPFIPGMGAAGVITAIGRQVTDFTIGEPVLFSNPALAKGGSWADYTVVPAHRLIRKPEALDFTQAAALPVTGEAAVLAMDLMAAEPGKVVLIAGAIGAAGLMAVQIAVMRRLWVLATAEPKHLPFLRRLGAQAVFNPGNERWARQVREFAMAGVSGAVAIEPGIGPHCLVALRDGGKLVLLDDDDISSERGIGIHRVEHDHGEVRHLQWLTDEVIAKRLRVVIDGVYPWEKAAEALDRLDSGETLGTVVLSVHEE